MLNFNDGHRQDWPNLCTLTIFGYKYYQRFGYIYNPQYDSVYCDNEQTDVGRLLNRIHDIDTVIIRHEWNAPVFQDDLRRRTETTELYKRDHDVYLKRKAACFDLKTDTASSSSSSSLITIVIVTNTSVGLEEKIEQLEQVGLTVICHYSKDMKVFSFSYLHRLTFMVTTPYLTFCFMNEDCLPEYYETVSTYLKSHSETDALFFDQQCSFDKGQTTFTVKSALTNPNDTIPIQGPWTKEYRRSLSNWTIYKSKLWHQIVPCTDDNELMKQLVKNIQNWYPLNKVLYSYVV